MAVSPIPTGFHSITPYLIVKDAAKAIDWYKAAFGAEEKMRLTGPGGVVGHAELQFGDSILMLADEHPAMHAYGPEHYQGSPITLLIYLENVDEVFAQSIAVGAELVRPVQDQFYGDRSGMIKDPFGHQWSMATHIEDISPEELQKRVDSMASGPEE